MVFTTTAFEELTLQTLKIAAPEGARFVVVPHPLGGTPAEIVKQWGREAADHTIQALTERSISAQL